MKNPSRDQAEPGFEQKTPSLEPNFNSIFPNFDRRTLTYLLKSKQPPFYSTTFTPTTQIHGLKPLQELINQGLQPLRREFWLFLDIPPYRVNGLQIDSESLPTDRDCMAVAGLDIVLVFDGYRTRYGVLRRLCGSILAARPHLFWIFDRDYKKIAHLKIGARKWEL